MFISTIILGVALWFYCLVRLSVSTISDELRVGGALKVGTASSPPAVNGGAGAMDMTNLPNGSLWLRNDADTLPQVVHNSAIVDLALSGRSIECRIGTLTANQANTYQMHLPRGAIITGVSRRYTTVPASAGGTVVVGVTLNGNAVLASSSENEIGLTNDTLAAHALTSTTANLKGTVGQKVIITITSNNADMTGGTGCVYEIYYKDN